MEWYDMHGAVGGRCVLPTYLLSYLLYAASCSAVRCDVVRASEGSV